MHRRLAVGIAVAVVLTLVAGATFVTPTGGNEDVGNPPALAQLDDIDSTAFEITVFESGDARWEVEVRRRISSVDTSEIEEFETFADEFVSEETETFRNFRLRAEELTQTGTDLTDREMEAVEFRRDANYYQINQTGVVEMSFRWHGFAERRGERVIVSDVFDGGFGILEEQRLEIKHGDTLRFESITPTPDSLDVEGDVTGSEWAEWRGPVDFDSGHPNVTFVPADREPVEDQDGTAGDDTAASPDGSDNSPGGEGGDSDMMLPIFLATVLLISIGGAVWYVSSRDQPGTATTQPGAQTETTESTTTEEVSVSEEELLSDEDRVIDLLEENGGRMRQVSIVEETEWSKSKVSMLLSDMEEEGEISKLRVGRENIISLSGNEPDAAGSPFEDDE